MSVKLTAHVCNHTMLGSDANLTCMSSLRSHGREEACVGERKIKETTRQKHREISETFRQRKLFTLWGSCKQVSSCFQLDHGGKMQWRRQNSVIPRMPTATSKHLAEQLLQMRRGKLLFQITLLSSF